MSFDRIDLTNDTKISEAVFYGPLALTSLADDSALSLVAGLSETIGFAPYRINTSALAVTDSASNGVAFVYIYDTGSTVTAELLNDVPTYSQIKNGWYNGKKKAIFALIKSTGPVYSDKQRIEDYMVEYYNLTARTSLTINDANNTLFSGDAEAFDLSAYYGTNVNTQRQGSHAFKFGKAVMMWLDIIATPFTAPTTLLTGLPAAWQPSAAVYFNALDTTTSTSRVYLNGATLTMTDATLDPTYGATVFGFYYTA
jgi:hypothetical protein